MEEINNLLERDELRKALEIMDQLVEDSSVKSTISLLLGRLSANERDKDRGTSSDAELKLERNRIRASAKSVLTSNASRFRTYTPPPKPSQEHRINPDDIKGIPEEKFVPHNEFSHSPEINKNTSAPADNKAETPSKTKMFKLALGLLVGMALFSIIGWGVNQLRKPSLSDYAASLKLNVVKITSSFGDGKSENGFGFITGEKDGVLYIITAKHVVIPSNVSTLERLEARAEEISVEFEPEPRKNYTAEFVLGSETLDLALIKVQKSGIDWIRPAADFDPQKSKAVTFIGKNEEWYIPEEAGSGSINSNIDELVVDINSVESGTSGAPLVTKEGIVGLIYKTNRSRAWAVSLEDIRKFVLYDVFGGRLEEAFLLK